MHVYIRITYNTLIKLNRTIYCCICLNNKELAKWRCYCQDCQHKKLTSSKLYFKFSNCCCMLDYLSLKYRCSSNKFHFLLWVEIDRNIFKIQHYELHLQLLCTVCHKTRVKPSYIFANHHQKALAVQAGFLLLHHLYTTLDSKKLVSDHRHQTDDSQNFLTPQQQSPIDKEVTN